MVFIHVVRSGGVGRAISAVLFVCLFVSLVRSLPNKQCSSDPQPTWLMKANADILSPFLCQLFNSCLAYDTVPSSFKSGYGDRSQI